MLSKLRVIRWDTANEIVRRGTRLGSVNTESLLSFLKKPIKHQIHAQAWNFTMCIVYSQLFIVPMAVMLFVIYGCSNLCTGWYRHTSWAFNIWNILHTIPYSIFIGLGLHGVGVPSKLSFASLILSAIFITITLACLGNKYHDKSLQPFITNWGICSQFSCEFLDSYHIFTRIQFALLLPTAYLMIMIYRALFIWKPSQKELIDLLIPHGISSAILVISFLLCFTITCLVPFLTLNIKQSFMTENNVTFCSINLDNRFCWAQFLFGLTFIDLDLGCISVYYAEPCKKIWSSFIYFRYFNKRSSFYRSYYRTFSCFMFLDVTEACHNLG